jgi:hypothetical protein
MQQFRIQRTIGVVPVVSGGSATFDLPRGYDYESLYLRLYGQLQITGAATAVRAEAPCQALQRVEIVADGRNTIYSAPFWAAVFGNYARPSQLDSGARYATPPSAVAIAAYSVEAGGTVDFATMDGERPKDSNFRTSGLQLFQVRFTFGTAADCWVGGAGHTFGTGLNVEINTEEMIELPDPATGQQTKPGVMAKTSYQEFAVTSSNVNQELRLPAGNLIKSVILRCEGLTTAGEPTTGMLNELQAASGVDVRLKMSGNSLRMKNNNDFGYILPGYYIADFTRNGSVCARLSELWDVTKQAEPKVSMNVTGGATGKAQLVVREYIGL